MTVYLPDVASYQAGIDLAGALAVAIKITEGTGYRNPYFAAQEAEAAKHGAFTMAYHFLHGGNGAGQAEYCHAQAGRRPLMLDIEPVYAAGGTAARRSEASLGMSLPRAAASVPTVGDAAAFIDAYRRLGGVVWLDYFPKWYWQQLGSPPMTPLTGRGMWLWSSDYGVNYTDDDSGRGWQPYGGRTPLIWQYTSSMRFGGQGAVDFSAFRGHYAGDQSAAGVAGCLAELKSLAATGKWPAPVPPGEWTYPPPLAARAVVEGAHSVRLGWTHAPAPAGKPPPWTVVFIYTGHGACTRANIVPGYPRPAVPGNEHLYGALDPAVTGTRRYTAHVVAADPGGRHARPYAYATVQFDVSGLRLDGHPRLRQPRLAAARPGGSMGVVPAPSHHRGGDVRRSSGWRW